MVNPITCSCEGVDLLSEKIADGERVPQELLQRDRRIDQLASKQCTREDHQKIVRAQRSVSNILSVNKTLAYSPKTTPFVSEPAIPAFRPGWKSCFMQCDSLYTCRSIPNTCRDGRECSTKGQILPSLSLTTEHKPLCASTGKQSGHPQKRAFPACLRFF